MQAPQLSGKKLCLVPILRAGNGILDGMLDLVPGGRVGHIGLYRDPHTLEPVEYYLKLPDDIEERLVIVVDPMLATGNSAAAAVARAEAGAAKQFAPGLPDQRTRRPARASTRSTPTCRYSPRRSTAAWTITATSVPASATPATGCYGTK